MGKQEGRAFGLFAGMFERVGEGSLWQAEGEMWRMPHQAFIPPSGTSSKSICAAAMPAPVTLSPGFIHCCKTRRAGSLPRTSTRIAGRMTPGHCSALSCEGDCRRLGAVEIGERRSYLDILLRACSGEDRQEMGSALITETMEKRPEIGFTSYDRFFPSQDTMPLGGFGNLIALPLQRKARGAVIGFCRQGSAAL